MWRRLCDPFLPELCFLIEDILDLFWRRELDIGASSLIVYHNRGENAWR